MSDVLLGAGKSVLTVEEILSVIKRSSLRTIVTEGRDDFYIFRNLETSLSDLNVSLLPAGGRTSLLSVFTRRAETGKADEIAFIADRDLWVMSDIPTEYRSNSLVFTDGYSIENDLYRDGELEKMLDSKEKKIFTQRLTEFVRWYAFAMTQESVGIEQRIDVHPNKVLDGLDIRLSFAQEIDFSEPPKDMIDFVMTYYERVIRGKCLLELIMGQLNHPKRHAKHNYRALLDYSSSRNGRYMSLIRLSIEEFYNCKSVAC